MISKLALVLAARISVKLTKHKRISFLIICSQEEWLTVLINAGIKILNLFRIRELVYTSFEFKCTYFKVLWGRTFLK